MSTAPDRAGTLFVVATPIGNLSDLSPRVRAVLESADLVLAEDTRHTGALLDHLALEKPLRSLHEHNEADRVDGVLERLRNGEQIALISDAGTPLISDPGYRLLAAVRASGLRATPVPGPCAAIAALSVCGLATDRFAFEGFLPQRRSARRARLELLRDEPRTLIIYEAGRRVTASLEDMAEAFGSQRRATLARELTKVFEEITHGTLQSLTEHTRTAPQATRGELVLVVEGTHDRSPGPAWDAERVLRLLLDELPLRQAASLAAKLTDVPRNELYRRALLMRGAGESAD
jgi:16S rRNA (cytidine1402-2'-O)-methyltransferase